MEGRADHAEAWEIAEMLLEKTGTAMWVGDFKTFLSAFALPYIHATEEGMIEICQTADMRAIFESVRGHFQNAGVTRIIRMCVAAEFVDDDRINSTHESHLFVGNHRIRPPYPVLSQLERTELGWQIRASNYAVSHDPGHADALMPMVLPSELAKRIKDRS
jgi:hypothetical protein